MERAGTPPEQQNLGSGNRSQQAHLDGAQTDAAGREEVKAQDHHANQGHGPQGPGHQTVEGGPALWQSAGALMAGQKGSYQQSGHQSHHRDHYQDQTQYQDDVAPDESPGKVGGGNDHWIG